MKVLLLLLRALAFCLATAKDTEIKAKDVIVTEENINQLIKDLGAAKSKDRKAALKRALALSNKDKAELYEKLVESDDPELKSISETISN